MDPNKDHCSPIENRFGPQELLFQPCDAIGPFHQSHFYSKIRDINFSCFSLVGPYLRLTWLILIIELFRPHDNAKWPDHWNQHRFEEYMLI